MVRPREHEIRQTELADRIQSLEFERFEEVEGQRIQANRAMNRVRNRLQIRHPTRQPVPAYIDSARPFDGPLSDVIENGLRDPVAARTRLRLGQTRVVETPQHRVEVIAGDPRALDV